MNLPDILFIIPIAWMAYRGFTKGFIIELCSLIALIAGIYIAINFSEYAAEFLTRNFKTGDKYLGIFAFVLTFIVVVAGVFLVGKILERFINLLLLGFLNKLVGLLFGAAKAAFLISVILWIINSFNISSSLIKEETKKQSYLYKPLEGFAPGIIPNFKLNQLEEINVKAVNAIDKL